MWWQVFLFTLNGKDGHKHSRDARFLVGFSLGRRHIKKSKGFLCCREKIMAQTGHSDDLDQLLDSALDDFQTLNLASSAQSRDDGVKKSEGFSNVSRVEGLGMGLPELGRKKKGKKKVKVASHVSETLKKLRQQTTEAVKGMESVAASKASGVDAFGFGFGEDALIEDWVKQLEEVAGSQDMESMVETMMQQLLSEEVVDDPIKEIGERYPKWLQDNKSNLEKAEYDRYFHQHQLIKDLNQIDPANFNKILDLMHRLQESGQPPTDILKDLAPDFDISALAQLSPEMLDSQENCCIM